MSPTPRRPGRRVIVRLPDDVLAAIDARAKADGSDRGTVIAGAWREASHPMVTAEPDGRCWMDSGGYRYWSDDRGATWTREDPREPKEGG